MPWSLIPPRSPCSLAPYTHRGGGNPLNQPSITYALLPLLPLALWASLGLWDLLGASGSLGSLRKPLAALGLQSDSGTLLPLLPPTPLLPSPPHSPCPLSLPGPLGPSWGLRKPWEPLEAFGSPWVFSQTQRPCSPCSSCSPHPHSPLPSLLPLTPWTPGTFLGPQEALGAFGSLWQPWVFRLRDLAPPHLPLAPLTSLAPLNSLAPHHPLSLPGPLGPFWGLRKPWEPWEAFGSPWVFSQTQGPCSPCSPHLPLAPWASLDPWDLPGASGSLGSLGRASGALGASEAF